MSEIKFEIVNKIGVLSKSAELDGMITHILSAFPLVGEDVKSKSMEGFRRMGK
jgi:hypothetical protein